MKHFQFKYLLLVSFIFLSCSEEIDVPVVVQEPVTAGSADFSKYVALGNSLTAGFSDGALFRAAQENAYPNLMSQKFAEVGGGAFATPFTNNNIGGLLAGGVQIQGPRLIFNGTAPVPLPEATPTTEIAVPLTGPFNNLGVPGAKSFHLLAPNYGNIAGVSTGAANPYFVRFRSSAATSVLLDATAQNPTFFSLWIGNNDVLSFATSGGIGVNQSGNLNPATYGPNDITDSNAFTAIYSQMIDALTANGAKGVVANIPNVSSVPFFTTIPFNAVPLDAATANALNTGLIGPVKQILTLFGEGDRVQLLVAGNNPLMIVDEGLTNLGPQIQATAAASGNPQLIALAPFLGANYGQVRHAKPGDLFPLTTRTIIGQPAGTPVPTLNAFGVSFPLQDQHALVPVELAMIKTATDAYNASIKSIAEAKGLAFVDVNALMVQLSTSGIRLGNFHMTNAFVQGGAFGLDGIHVTARGNAFIANKFLEAIEKTYGSRFNKFSPESFPFSYPAFLSN